MLAAAGVLVLVRRDLPSPSLSLSWLPVLAAAITCAAWIAIVPVDAAAGGRFLAALQDLGAAERWAWIAVRLVGSCLLVPVVEELAFRGFLTRWLIAFDIRTVQPGQFTWFSFLGSSVAFGFLHSSWLAGTLAGMFFALALYRRRDLADLDGLLRRSPAAQRKSNGRTERRASGNLHDFFLPL